MSDSDRLPSRLVAGIYLVVGIAALILTSRPQASTTARYAIGIGVEVALAVLALTFMRLERLPVRIVAQLHRPQTRTFWLALVAVPGLWMIGVVLNLLSSLVLGYTTSVTPAQYPATWLEAVLLALTTVVVAPVCEELMFRGYVQRAFEARHRWIGVVVGGVIFAIYHLRFQGLFSLIPIALGLGLIAWRTESLYPSMVAHAGFNSIATVVLVSTSFLPMRAVTAISAMLICVGALMTPFSLTALWLLWRTTAPDAGTARATLPRGIPEWVWIVPVITLLGVYGYAAASEVLLNRFPEVTLDDDLALVADDSWSLPVTWHYSIQDRLGREQGRAVCTRAPSAQEITLDCSASHAGFDLTAAIPGLLKDSDGSLPEWLPQLSGILNAAIESEPTAWTLSTTWSRPALEVTALVVHEEQGQGEYTLEYVTSGTGSVLSLDRSGEPPIPMDALSQESLMPREWAWRSSGLGFRLPYGSHVALVSGSEQGVDASVEAFLQVVGGEPIWTPAGNYVTWRVDLTWNEASGSKRMESAWYDSRAPHTLVRYDDGSMSYVLTRIE